MAIFRCNKCTLLAEQPDELSGQSIACPKCGKPAVVYSTMFFIEKLLDKYFDAQRELIRLKSAMEPAIASPESEPTKSAQADIDLANSDFLATELQHGPIYDWFHKKQIKVQANMRGVDTTGFFDEVAEAVGSNFNVLKEVLERIRWSQQKEHAGTTIHLERNHQTTPRQSRLFASSFMIFHSLPSAFITSRKIMFD
jgi:hypothetical protein